ncbi:replication protein P [Nitrincola tapanii]|uniref:Uncharacterized protein n=1 Tax=Nitrincola tapanii TaxID=1708751 RepID=A0A5A9W2Z5_9GAMM|nr:replication protein P [Nitrincola tapanii]KAA0874972.1 hypothetical protein E1H14_05985 [Nitrincola tapanii]
MIFARFMAIYGHKFKSCFETQDELRLAKREWALSLEGFSEAELVSAVNRCKDSLAWMPSIAEFLALLREQRGELGLPSAHQAYREACLHAEHPSQHRWSHPIVYLAGKETGWFELRGEDEAQVFPQFDYVYQLLVQRVQQGEEIEMPLPKALPDQREVTVARFIQAFAQTHGLADDVAASLLYYLTKPLGSRVRERLHQQAQTQAEALGLKLLLPKQVDSVS